MTPSEKAQAAEAALQVMGDALTELQEQSLTALLQSQPEDTELREQAYREIKALEALEGKLKEWIRDHQYPVTRKGQHRGSD